MINFCGEGRVDEEQREVEECREGGILNKAAQEAIDVVSINLCTSNPHGTCVYRWQCCRNTVDI
jgi:hypothetical protein